MRNPNLRVVIRWIWHPEYPVLSGIAGPVLSGIAGPVLSGIAGPSRGDRAPGEMLALPDVRERRRSPDMGTCLNTGELAGVSVHARERGAARQDLRARRHVKHV